MSKQFYDKHRAFYDSENITNVLTLKGPWGILLPQKGLLLHANDTNCVYLIWICFKFKNLLLLITTTIFNSLNYCYVNDGSGNG